MGQTVADTQHEIEAIRGDASAAAAELQTRLRAGPTALFRSGNRPVDRVLSEQRPVQGALAVVRENTLALGVLAAMALGALGWVLYSALEQRRQRRKPYSRLLRRAQVARGQVDEHATRAGRELDKRRERGILVKVEKEAGDYVRVTDVRVG
jgi:hypothetical protein